MESRLATRSGTPRDAKKNTPLEAGCFGEGEAAYFEVLSSMYLMTSPTL